ncbi:isoprenylcysteine carboxyl methyltransferase family protein [Domibacillus epiphyticus]|uniref:Isoprenylcysteine carboxyl methyltransferase n=1 Tax=Domibacillus epiphyticus TaxID=1714355 RepID=A0A1V2A5I8_9BACI|nr:isoprenylcysteine carboxyl methyltransferase family protein [Domibacillus epiphyticus]OMP66064.1 isoprenylcysteine carboxyl methyltransferase [Domibacillus epiphyticus]
MIFLFIITIVCLQRIVELVIARRNEKWMRKQGAVEAGAEHYPLIVALHICFFISLAVEVVMMERSLSPWWPLLLTLFLFAQAGRVWSLFSLGRFWNTKIIILPGAKVVKRGPYRWIRHPNYVIVAAEILVLPLLFQAYYTALVFSVLNAIVLSIRIPTEEKALMKATDYNEIFRKG